MKVFDSVSDLAASKLVADQLVEVKEVGQYRIKASGSGITLANSYIAVPVATNGGVSVKQFGAIGDGVTDDTAAIQAAIDTGNTVVFSSGIYKATSTITLSDQIILKGLDNSFDCMIQFTGTGATAVRTSVTHPNDGTDAAISVGLLVTGPNVIIENILVDLYCDYSDTSSSNLGDDWDVGILVKSSNFRMVESRCRGYWREAGLWFDNTDDNGNCDGATLEDVRLQGKWGLKIKGPNLESGQTEIDNTTDFRGSGGISDFIAINGHFEGYNHHSGQRPDDSDGGCMWVDGAVDPGTAATDAIQGHRYIGCRFYTFDPYALKLGKTIRDFFVGCFIERITGKFQSDGTTPAGDSDIQVYSQPVGASGGTKSLRLIGTDIYRLTNNFSRDDGFYIEQTVNQNLTQVTSRAEGVHEYPQGVRIGTATGNTPLDYYNQGTFVPALGFVTAAYNSRSGDYTRIGNMVFVKWEIDASSIDTADTSVVHLDGLPFDIANQGNVLLNIDYTNSTAINFAATDSVQATNNANSVDYIRLAKPDGTEISYNSGLINASGVIIATMVYTTDA